MNLFKSIALGLGILAAGVTLAEAQTPVVPKVYPLTNSTTLKVSTGALCIPTATVSNVASVTVPVWRDRGFALNLGIYGTNSGTATITNVLRTATVQSIGGTSVTNWTSLGITNTCVMNGTTEVFATFVVPKTTADNVGLVQLWQVNNGHTASIFLDPTNSFISVIP